MSLLNVFTPRTCTNYKVWFSLYSVTFSIFIKKYCICHNKYQSTELAATVLTDGNAAGCCWGAAQGGCWSQRRRKICLFSGCQTSRKQRHKRGCGELPENQHHSHKTRKGFSCTNDTREFLVPAQSIVEKRPNGSFLVVGALLACSNAPLAWVVHGIFFPQSSKSGILDKISALGFVGSKDGKSV